MAVSGSPWMFMLDGTRYDIMAVYGNWWMLLVDGTRYYGCIWELVDVYGRWN